MTEATVFRSKRDGGRIAGFEACGHTGFAESGNDIVCAAVSVLTESAVIGITEYLHQDCALDISEGHIYCMLPADISENAWREAEIILETMAMGLKSLAGTYGDYIKLIEREV